MPFLLYDDGENLVKRRQGIKHKDLRPSLVIRIIEALKETQDTINVSIFLHSHNWFAWTSGWRLTWRDRPEIAKFVPENLDLSEVISDREITLLQKIKIRMYLKNSNVVALRKSIAQCIPHIRGLSEPNDAGCNFWCHRMIDPRLNQVVALFSLSEIRIEITRFMNCIVNKP